MDWNHNGRHDAYDRFVDMEIMNEMDKDDNRNNYSGRSGGGKITIGTVLLIIFFIFCFLSDIMR